MTDATRDPPSDHDRGHGHEHDLIGLIARIQVIVVLILAFVVFSMLWAIAQRWADVAELRKMQRESSVQIAAMVRTLEYLATEEAARKAENERSKADRAQLNARAAKAEADRRRIERALEQIGEIREIVGRSGAKP